MASSPSSPSRSREARWWASSSCWQSTLAASAHQTDSSSFMSPLLISQSMSSIHQASWSIRCRSTRLSVRASWPRNTVEGLVEMWGERSSNRARRLNMQPTSRGRPALWGNSSTVTSFSSKNRRSHPLEAESRPSVTEPGQHQELIPQIDFKTCFDLHRV